MIDDEIRQIIRDLLKEPNHVERIAVFFRAAYLVTLLVESEFTLTDEMKHDLTACAEMIDD